MNIIEMAIKANLLSGGKEKMSKNLLKVEETIEAQVLEFASLVAAHEREACAKVCDEQFKKYGCVADKCASAVRARSEK